MHFIVKHTVLSQIMFMLGILYTNIFNLEMDSVYQSLSFVGRDKFKLDRKQRLACTDLGWFAWAECSFSFWCIASHTGILPDHCLDVTTQPNEPDQLLREVKFPRFSEKNPD